MRFSSVYWFTVPIPPHISFLTTYLTSFVSTTYCFFPSPHLNFSSSSMPFHRLHLLFYYHIPYLHILCLLDFLYLIILHYHFFTHYHILPCPTVSFLYLPYSTSHFHLIPYSPISFSIISYSTSIHLSLSFNASTCHTLLYSPKLYICTQYSINYLITH